MNHRKPDLSGAHAASMIVPPVLIVGTIALVLITADRLASVSGTYLDDTVTRFVWMTVLLLVVTGGLAAFLWIGQWWTEESDRPLARLPARPAPPAVDARRARSRLDVWDDEGGR